MADTQKDLEILQNDAFETEQLRVDTINRQALAAYKEKQQAALSQPAGQTLKEENIPRKDLFGFKPILPRRIKINNSALLDLAKERSLLVYDYFVRSLGISPQRLNITQKTSISSNSPAHGVHIEITTALPNN